MKKAPFFLLVFLLWASFTQAQEESIAMAKSALRALTSYNIDAQNNAGKLDEGKKSCFLSN